MKKAFGLILTITLLFSGSVFALDEDVFRSTLVKFSQVAIPVTAMKGKMGDDVYSKGGNGKGGNASQGEFPFLTAEKLNKQIEVLIQGIESAKGVATALAVIVNLYESNKISVEVAITAVQILKLRAVFLKVFLSNGSSELEIMIKVLEDNETELGKHMQAKRSVDAQVNGRINAAQSGY